MEDWLQNIVLKSCKILSQTPATPLPERPGAWSLVLQRHAFLPTKSLRLNEDFSLRSTKKHRMTRCFLQYVLIFFNSEAETGDVAVTFGAFDGGEAAEFFALGAWETVVFDVDWRNGDFFWFFNLWHVVVWVAIGTINHVGRDMRAEVWANVFPDDLMIRSDFQQAAVFALSDEGVAVWQTLSA